MIKNDCMRKSILTKIVIFVILTALLFLQAGIAYAEEIVLDTELPVRLTDWEETIQVAQFDPALGRLLRVETIVSGKLNGTAKFESLDAAPAEVTVSMTSEIKLFRSDGRFINSAHPSASFTDAVTEYDQLFDYGGSSGRTIEDLIAYDVSDTGILTNEVDLADFIGDGTIDLTVSGAGRSRATGAGNMGAAFSLGTSASMTITYIYEPPVIDIEKHTNGEDADEETGPFIKVGSPVTWEYFITNTGAQTLTNVTVVDNQGVTVECPKDLLAPAETMTCTASGVATAGQYANIGTVAAQPVDEQGVPQGNIVTAEDPSHYFGEEEMTSCPTDPLPDIVYLGGNGSRSGPQLTFELPEGYDVFIVKRVRPQPFHFAMEEGEVNEAGRTVYTTLPNRWERVWACSGDCAFTTAVAEEAIEVGQFTAGSQIHLVMIDDDHDDRVDWWAANDPAEQTEIVTEDGMTVYLDYTIPFDAFWYFSTMDSIGLVKICIDEPTETVNRSANGEQEAQTFLPIVSH